MLRETPGLGVQNLLQSIRAFRKKSSRGCSYPRMVRQRHGLKSERLVPILGTGPHFRKMP